MKIIIALLLLAPFSSFAKDKGSVASTTWLLEKSKITYVVIHPLHRVEGISEQAKGKGVCKAEACDFLVAAPVKSFDSGNSNRDAHMWQTTRAEKFPMVQVGVKTPRVGTGKKKFELQVSLAGETHVVPAELNLESVGDKKVRLTGEFTITFSEFKMDRPSLLAVPVKNDIHVSIDETWSETK